MSDQSRELKTSKKSYRRRKAGLPRLSLGRQKEEKGILSNLSSVRRGPGTNTAQLGSEFNGTQFNHFPEVGPMQSFGKERIKDAFQFGLERNNVHNRAAFANGNQIGDGNSNADGASQRVPSVSHSKTSRKKVDMELNNAMGMGVAGSGRRLGRDGSSQFTGSLGQPLEPRNREFKLSGGGASFNDFPLNSRGNTIMREESFMMTPNVNNIPSRSRMGPGTEDMATMTSSFFAKPVPMKPVKSQNKKDSRKSFGLWTNNGTIVEMSEYSKTMTKYSKKTSELIAQEIGNEIRNSISKSKEKSRSRRSLKKRRKKILKINKQIIDRPTKSKQEGPRSILKRTPVNGPKTKQSRKSVRFNEEESVVFEFPVERNHEERFQTLLERSNQQSFCNESENTSKMIPSVPNLRSRFNFPQAQKEGNQILMMERQNYGPKTVQPKKRAHFFNFPGSNRETGIENQYGSNKKFGGFGLPPLIEEPEINRPKSSKSLKFDLKEQQIHEEGQEGLINCSDSIQIQKKDKNQRKASRNIIKTIKRSIRSLKNVKSTFFPMRRENKINVSLIDEKNNQVEFDIEFKGETKIDLKECLMSSAEPTPKSRNLSRKSFNAGFEPNYIDKIQEEEAESPRIYQIEEEKVTKSRVSERAKKIGIKPISLKLLKSKKETKRLSKIPVTSIIMDSNQTTKMHNPHLQNVDLQNQRFQTPNPNERPKLSRSMIMAPSELQLPKSNPNLIQSERKATTRANAVQAVRKHPTSLYLDTKEQILHDAKQRTTNEAVSELLGKYAGMGFVNAKNEANDFDDYITNRLGNKNWGKFAKMVLKLLYGESIHDSEFKTLSNGFQKMFKKFLVDRYFKDVKEKIKTRLETIPGVKDLVAEGTKTDSDIWGLGVEDYSNFFDHFEDYEANTKGDKNYPMVTNFLMLLEKKVEEYLKQARKFQNSLEQEQIKDRENTRFKSKHSGVRLDQTELKAGDRKAETPQRPLLGKRNDKSFFRVQEVTTIKQVENFQKSYTPQHSEFKCHQRAIIGKDDEIYVQDESESGANAFMMTPKDSIIPSFGFKMTPKQKVTEFSISQSQDITKNTQFKFNNIRKQTPRDSQEKFNFESFSFQTNKTEKTNRQGESPKRNHAGDFERSDIRIFQGSLVELLEEVCPNAMTRNRLKKMLRMFLSNFTNDLILSLVQKEYSERNYAITDEGDGLVDETVAAELTLAANDLTQRLKLAVVDDQKTRVDYTQTWKGDIDVATIQDFLAKREALNCLERKRNNSFRRPRRNDEKVKKIYKQIMSYFFEDFKAKYFGVATKKDPITFTIDIHHNPNSRNKSRKDRGKIMNDFSYAFKPNEMELCFYVHFFGHLCKPKLKFLPERVPTPNIGHTNPQEQERRWAVIRLPVKDITARVRALIEIGTIKNERLHLMANPNFQTPNRKNHNEMENSALSFKEYQHQQRSGKKAPSVLSKKSKKSRKSMKPTSQDLEKIDSFFDPIKNKLRNTVFRSFKPDFFRHLLRAAAFREGVILYLGEGIVGSMLSEYSAELGKKIVKKKFCLLEMQKKKSKFFWNRFEIIVALEHFKKKFCRDILVLPSPKGDVSFSMRIMEQIRARRLQIKGRTENLKLNQRRKLENEQSLFQNKQVGVRLRDFQPQEQMSQNQGNNMNNSNQNNNSFGNQNSVMVEEESQKGYHGMRRNGLRNSDASQRYGMDAGPGTIGGDSAIHGFFGSDLSLGRVDTGSLRPDTQKSKKKQGSQMSFAFGV